MTPENPSLAHNEMDNRSTPTPKEMIDLHEEALARDPHEAEAASIRQEDLPAAEAKASWAADTESDKVKASANTGLENVRSEIAAEMTDADDAEQAVKDARPTAQPASEKRKAA